MRSWSRLLLRALLAAAGVVALASCKRAAEKPPPALAARPLSAVERTRIVTAMAGVTVGGAHVDFVGGGQTGRPLAVAVTGSGVSASLVEIPLDGLRDPHWTEVLPVEGGRIAAVVLGIRGGDWDWDTLLVVSSADGGRTWHRGEELFVADRFGDPTVKFAGRDLTLVLSVVSAPSSLDRLGPESHEPDGGQRAWRSSDLGLHWHEASP